MRRLLLCFLLAFPLLALGEQSSERVLSDLNSSLKQMADYRVEFSVDMPQMMSVSGFYVVSGDKFYIEVGGNAVGSDGEVRFEVNEESEEVNVDYASSDKSDLLSNPAYAFDFVSDKFTHKLVNSAGEATSVVELVPVDNSLAVQLITLSVNNQTKLPKKLSYKMEGESQIITIEINKIEKIDSVDVDLFQFTNKRYKGYEIIDFR